MEQVDKQRVDSNRKSKCQALIAESHAMVLLSLALYCILLQIGL